MQLTSAFMLSRLDYCNSILAGLQKSSIATLQRVQNAAARLVLGLGPCDHISDGLRQLHWLPVEARIRYKLCLLMHMTHTGRCPPYLTDVLHPVSPSSGRSGLRSATTAQYVKPRLRTVFGWTCFFIRWTQVMDWFTQSPTDTVTSTDSYKRQLKTHLLKKIIKYCLLVVKYTFLLLTM